MKTFRNYKTVDVSDSQGLIITVLCSRFYGVKLHDNHNRQWPYRALIENNQGHLISVYLTDEGKEIIEHAASLQTFLDLGTEEEETA